MPKSKLRKAGIKRPKQYQGLRKKGMSKKKAAKIANSKKKGKKK